MSDRTHGILLDLMSMHALSSEYGCGLDPYLLEMLKDRHATPDGCLPFARDIRHDGPVQGLEPDQAAPLKDVHDERR